MVGLGGCHISVSGMVLMEDIAATSIDQARKRYEGLYRPGFGADFFAFDCFGVCPQSTSACVTDITEINQRNRTARRTASRLL